MRPKRSCMRVLPQDLRTVYNSMALHLPFFFGTTPMPEVRRLCHGGSVNGPMIRPAAISLASSASTMSGCVCAED